MGREVELKVKVDDSDVAKAEASLNRLKKAANDTGAASGGQAGLTQPEKLNRWVNEYRQQIKALLETKGASDTAAKAIAATTEAAEGLATGAGEAAGGLASMGAAAGPAIAGITAGLLATAAGAVALGKEIVSLAKHFADYALDIGNVAEETGLATETISALRYEAEATGRSFDSIKGPVEELRKTIGQAAAGSTEAQAKLNLLRIDGKRAIGDIDNAFRTAFETILKLPAGIDRATAAYAAFGSEGYKLIPLLQSSNGSVEELVKKAHELGLVVSNEDVAAAKEFNRAWVDVQKQIEGISNTFGRALGEPVLRVLRDLNDWAGRNKASITQWADATAAGVERMIAKFERLLTFVSAHPFLATSLLGIPGAASLTGAFDDVRNPPPPVRYSSNTPNSIDANAVYGTPTTIPGMTPDPAALEAARAEMEKKQKETIERVKRNWAAAIEAWQLRGSEAENELGKIFKSLQDKFAESGNAEQFKANVKATTNWYRGIIFETYQKLEELEDEQARRNNATAGEQAVLDAKQFARRKAYGEKAVAVEKQAAELIKRSQERSSEEYLRNREAQINREIEIYDERNKTEMQRREAWLESGASTEQQYINVTNKLQLDALDYRKTKLEELQRLFVKGSEKEKEIAHQIAMVNEQIAQQKLTNEGRLTEAAARRLAVVRAINKLEKENADPATVNRRRSDAANEDKLALLREISGLGDAIANVGINDGLIIEAERLRAILDLRNRELDAVISIQRSQLEIEHSMEISTNQIQARVLDHLARQKTLNEAIADGINKTYDAISGRMDEQIDKMFKWAGMFKDLFAEPLKMIARSNLTDFTTNLLDGILPGLGQKYKDATVNPVAKPIVDKLEQIRRLLLPRAGGAGSGGAGVFVPGLGTISLGGIGGIGGGTPPFNPGYFGGGGGGSLGSLLRGLRIPGDRTGNIDANGNVTVDGRSVLSKITGPGGVFGKEGFGNNAGTYGAIGAIGNVVGGAIGGRWGGVISMASTGLGIGATIGSMIAPGIGTAIGAAIGAAAGFIGGLFMGDPNRKKDKKENLPALYRGFTDAFKQLNEILGGVRRMTIDPDDAVAQAAKIRGEIAGGFGIEFLSKKYRKQSQALIASKLVEADVIIDQIKNASEIARGSADRNKRILPEFAAGHYFADYFRPNGLIPGAFDGADNILAMISRGEMVINPGQQNRVRALAGFDVFAGAGIPNYPRASSSPKLAAGGIAGAGLSPAAASPTIVVTPQIFIEGVAMDDRIKGYMTSDDGVRTQIAIQTKLKKRNEPNR